MPVSSRAIIAGLACLVAAAPSLAAAAAAETSSPTEYAVRADPKYADRLNPLFGKIAKPTEYQLPAGETVMHFFDRICDRVPDTGDYRMTNQDGAAVVTAQPCLRVRRGVQVRIAKGDYLEPVAVRLGLAPQSWRTFKLKPAPAGASRGLSANAVPQLVVTAPLVPEWTDIAVDPAQIPDRKALVGLVAKAMYCKEPPEDCLSKRGVLVSQKALPTKPAIAPATPSPKSESPAKTPTPSEPENHDQAAQPRLIPARWTASPVRLSAAFRQDQPPAPVQAPDVQVAPDQWPYDPVLIAKLLTALKAKAKLLPASRVGVEDIGLADRKGAPFSSSLFYVSDEDAATAADPDSGVADSDPVAVFGVGSGAARPGVRALGPSRDVALCASGLNTSGWGPDARRFASHGAVVTSLASGYPLRSAFPDLDPVLPRVAFYRLTPETCAPDDKAVIGDAEMTNGLTYLLDRADILNLSYISDSSASDSLVSAIKSNLIFRKHLLFLPAGNQRLLSDDEIDNAPCPQCLVNPNGDSVIREQTVVVGAATRDLRRANYSGLIPELVNLYAPGEPIGALDISGALFDPKDAATSFAAPYAAFGAALLQTVGFELRWTSMAAIRARLMLSTWSPINGADPRQARVLDLIKVAAARYNTVEVIDRSDPLHPVLRDYVGVVMSGTETICGSKIEAKVQALQLGADDGQGNRKVRSFLRDFNPNSSTLKSSARLCQPSGEITLRELDGRDRKIDVATITQILFSWNATPLPIETAAASPRLASQWPFPARQYGGGFAGPRTTWIAFGSDTN